MRQAPYLKRRTLAAVTCYKKILDDECKIGQPADKLSQQLGVSRNVLQKAFMKLYGEPIREYKLRIRMERSLELLEAGEDLKVITLKLNYTKIRAFTTAFKRHYGYTPSNLSRSLEIEL
jgi:AraC-like DNA-binding protein